MAAAGRRVRRASEGNRSTRFPQAAAYARSSRSSLLLCVKYHPGIPVDGYFGTCLLLRVRNNTGGSVMAAVAAPIKVDAETDKLISHAAHFLGRSKKDVVDQAVREYIENHRDAIHEGVSSALKQLDGSLTASVTLLTGLSAEELDALGGIDESR